MPGGKSQLEQSDFVLQSRNMNPHWAEENLQTIRTLMERSALYRRALAPIMLFVGTVGIAGGVLGWLIQAQRGGPFLARLFVFYWALVATIALAGTFILVRRQALRDSEPFWSPPTRRVTQALLPAFVVGAVCGAIAAGSNGGEEGILYLVSFWCWAFGCAIHAAGFFMPRGMKVFGWVFVLIGCGICVFMTNDADSFRATNLPNFLMTVIFGGLHLAYGIYLYFTEPKNPVA